MIKQFNKDRSRWSLARPEWPDNPDQTPTVFSGRKPFRMLRVLVDAELIDVAESGDTLDKPTLLFALLHSEVVEFYRYANDGPPPEVIPLDIPDLDPPHPVYEGWAVAHPYEQEPGTWSVLYTTDPKDSFTASWVHGNIVEIARTDESQPVYAEMSPDQRAQRRAKDALALQVAEQALHADMFVTHRPYLYSGSRLVSDPDVTVCTLDEAIRLIALYLRAQGEFVMPLSIKDGRAFGRFRFGRGLYYWVGARELLPEAWRWFSACVQHSSGVGNDKLTLLGGSLLDRATKALRERDDVHIALNKPANNDTADEALSSLDNVLVALMGAVDVTARVAHYVLNLVGRERDAGWQNEGWVRRVAAMAPTLAAVVDPGTPGRYTLTILRLLRNSVHGAALQGVMYLLDGKAEPRIGLPPDDEATILAAMDAMGGRASWGVRSIGPGLDHIQPAVLVDRLFQEVVELLNGLMRETPVESLPHVTVTADTGRPPVEDPAKGKLDTFSEWNRLAIRWQLGL